MLAILSLVLIEYLPKSLVIIMAVYLMIKGLFFSLIGDSISLLDILSGLYFIAAVNGIFHWLFSIFVILFLLQKALPSVLS